MISVMIFVVLRNINVMSLICQSVPSGYLATLLVQNMTAICSMEGFRGAVKTEMSFRV